MLSIGVVILTGTAQNSEWFLRMGRVYLLVETFGRRATRVLYAVSGAACVLLGVYLLL